MKFWQGYLNANLGFKSSYWKTRKQLLGLKSWLWRRTFGIRETASNTTSDASYVKELAKGSVLPIILALLLVVLLHFFDNSISSYITKHNWQNWLSRRLTRPMNDNAYDQLLGTITAITGVFLGLYFTAVNTVVANVYSKVPSNIRSLIINDRVNNVYVRSATFLTAFSAILLGIHASGAHPFRLAPLIVILLVCFGIFTFAIIGRRAFYLADPTLLAGTITPEFFKWAKRSSTEANWWKSKDMQNMNAANGRWSLDSLSALVKVSSNQSHLQGDSYPRLIRQVSSVLIRYMKLKHHIPTDSSWFGRKFLHKQWYLVGATELEIASQTDSDLRPTEVPDEFWVESSVLQSILEAINIGSTNISYEQLYSKLNMLPTVMDQMGQCWAAEEGERWCSKVTERLITGMGNNKPDPLYVKPISVNGVIDILASLPLSLEIGFAKALDALVVTDIKASLLSINIDKPFAPYSIALPRRAIKTLEELQKNSWFEDKVDGKTISPNWYITERVLNSIDWALFDEWKTLMRLINGWYADNSKALSGYDLNIAASDIDGRALELSWKLERHLHDLQKKVEAIQADRKLDLPAPPWEWEKLQGQLKTFRTKTIERIAKSIPKLMPDDPNPDLPDYFGAAVHRTGEACFQALIDDDYELFKKIFVPYFAGILEASNKIRPQVEGWEPRNAMTWFSQPIIDLLEISGYAYIFSELYEKPDYWTECKRVWDAYINDGPGDNGDPNPRLQFIAATVYLHEHTYSITARATLRTSRQFALERKLRELPRQQERDDDRDIYSTFYDPPVEHNSAFIRRVAPRADMPMFVDAIDVFVVVYFMQLPGAQNLDFGINQSKVREIQPEDNDE